MAAKAGRLQIQLALEVAELRRDVQSVNSELKRASGSWQKSLSGIGGAIKGALIGGAVLGAVQQFGQAVSGIIDDMGRIADESAKLGDTAENFQRLEHAAGQAGVSMDAVVGASNRLQKSLGEIQKGGGKEAAEALNALGISIKDLQGLSTTDQLVKVAGALGDVQDKARQAATGATLFSRGWSALLPIIGEGEQGLRAAMDAAVVASDEAVAAGDAFGDALAAMQSASRALIAEGLAPLLPPFTALINVMKDSAAEAKDAQKDFSGWREIANLVAKGAALMVSSFMAVKAVFVTIGEAIGTFVAGAITQFGLLNEALDTPIFDGDAWRSLYARAQANGENFRQSFSDIADHARQSADDVQKFWTDAVAAIESAQTDLPAASGGTSGDTTATDTNTTAVKKNAAARKERNQAEAEWQRLIAAADELRDREIAKESDLIALQRDLQAERMRGANITEEEIRLWRLNIDNADEYTRAVSDLNAEIDRTRDANEAAREKAEEARQAQKQEIADWKAFVAGGIGDIFMAATEGADQAAEAVKRLVAELLAALAVKKALAIYDSFFPMGAAKGAAFGFGGAHLFAQGGIVTSPTAFAFGGGQLGVMGEAGPEAIMPLKRGPDGRLGVAGGGSVNVYNYGGAQVKVERDRDDLRIMIDQVRSQVASDISRGGNLISGALERAYKVRR